MPSSSYSIHERIILAATPLFAQRGIRQVSRQEVQQVAQVSDSEFAQEFSSRDDLATEVLERREYSWIAGIVEAGVSARATSPEGRLLAIFDVLDEWFHREDYEALSRADPLMNMGSGHPLGQGNADYLRGLRHLAARLAMQARLTDPAEFALSWHVLVIGSIVNAIEGDDRAASRAKKMGGALIAVHHPVGAAFPLTAEDLEDLQGADAACDEFDAFSTGPAGSGGSAPAFDDEDYGCYGMWDEAVTGV
jgi:AcrR family transcriptional regulator